MSSLFESIKQGLNETIEMVNFTISFRRTFRKLVPEFSSVFRRGVTLSLVIDSVCNNEAKTFMAPR